MRFPFTRKTDLDLVREGTIVSGNSSQPLRENATAESEVEIPFEVSFGASAFFRSTFRLAGSVTYSDWEDVQQITRNSSDTRLIPNGVLPYPSLRANALPQSYLLQLRGGLEYILGQPGNGLMLRAGIFRDGQPYGDREDDRTVLDGYSFGVGYLSRGFGIDAAFTREKGDFILTTTSQNTKSSFSFRRFLISFVWTAT
jgi:long-subunit fatty acid transport protein